MPGSAFAVGLPQQRVHPRIVIFRTEAGAVKTLQIGFGRAAHRAAAPGILGNGEGLGAVLRRQRERVARLGGVGQRWIAVEKGDQRLGADRVAVERGLGALLEHSLLWKAGMGGDEIGIGAKVKILLSAQVVPALDRLGHPRGLHGNHVRAIHG